MRIISGTFRGRLLQAPTGRDTRPTSARARGALFEILRDQIEGARIADLFAGTGALGLEALSRGAARVDFYESHRHALIALRANVEMLGVGKVTRLITSPLPEAIGAGDRYDLVVMDPPWREGHELRVARRLMTYDRLDADGLLVVESPRAEPVEEPLWSEIGLHLTDRRAYGDTELRFFSKLPVAVDPM